MNIWVEEKSKIARWVAGAIAGALKKVLVFQPSVFKPTPAQVKRFLEECSGQGVDVVVLSNEWKNYGRTDMELLVGDSDPAIKGPFVPFDEEGNDRVGDKIVEDCLNVLRERKLL